MLMHVNQLLAWKSLPSNISDIGTTADMQMFLLLSASLIEAEKNYHGGILYMNAQTQHLDGLINEALCKRNVSMHLFFYEKRTSRQVAFPFFSSLGLDGSWCVLPVHHKGNRRNTWMQIFSSVCAVFCNFSVLCWVCAAIVMARILMYPKISF